MGQTCNYVYCVGGQIAYNASKAAVVKITQTLGCEWADRGVAVNCMSPGIVNTALIQVCAGQGTWAPPCRQTDLCARLPFCLLYTHLGALGKGPKYKYQRWEVSVVEAGVAAITLALRSCGGCR